MNRIARPVLAAFFTTALFAQTPEADLTALRTLKSAAPASLAAALGDALAASAKVSAYKTVPTSGSAVRRFDATGKLTGYDLNYQGGAGKEDWERLGNVVPAATFKKESTSDVYRMEI